MNLRLLLSVSFVSAFFLQPLHASAEDVISRRDGFLLIWETIKRPAEDTRETPYIDVAEGSTGYTEITYAKRRGILRDGVRFYPDDALLHSDALLMLFRTRNIEPFAEVGVRKLMEIAEPEDIPLLASHYGLSEKEGAVRRAELLDMIQSLDVALASEEHEVSLYSEKFHGKGTAFGETFDMHALTAAHRTYPHHTLVRVTNVDNQKSVIVRINDRGPFIQGRNMDLSLAAFLEIEERSKGIARARFERLGDVSLLEQIDSAEDQEDSCTDTRFQRRIIRDVVLTKGIPHTFTFGHTLVVSSVSDFVVRDVRRPDGSRLGLQTWLTDGEEWRFSPKMMGTYTFLMGSVDGRAREMRMNVTDCKSTSEAL